MGKFLNGVAIGVLATLLYQKQKQTVVTEKSPLQNLMHATKQMRKNVNTLTKEEIPKALSVVNSIKKSIADFTIQEQPRIQRVQHYITILKEKGNS